jgi:hypothetical protein
MATHVALPIHRHRWSASRGNWWRYSVVREVVIVSDIGSGEE